MATKKKAPRKRAKKKQPKTKEQGREPVLSLIHI